MTNSTVCCQIKVRWKWRSAIFLVMVFLSGVKGTGVLLTANAVCNFVKYMLFTAAYNAQKKPSRKLLDSPRQERIYKKKTARSCTSVFTFFIFVRCATISNIYIRNLITVNIFTY